MAKNKRSQLQMVVFSLLVPLIASIGVLAFTILPAGKATGNTPPTTTVPTAPTDTLTLNLAAPGASPSNVGIGTNIQGWSDLTPADTQRGQVAGQLLDGWKPAMVRIHVGFRSETPPVSGPEEQEGKWDFTKLDSIVSTLRQHNISFFLDLRTAPPWMYDSTFHLPQSNFAAYAQYMARIVSWYNKGGFTDENGVYHKSGHINWIHTWEIWNEPKSSGDIPCIPRCPPGFTTQPVWMPADQYAELYNVTVTAMRAVDSTISTGGPALNGWPDDSYLQEFIKDETAPLDFISFHFYPATSATELDQTVFNEITGSRFLDRIQHIRSFLQQYQPTHVNVPIWITEIGMDEASTTTIRDTRGTDPALYAFLAGAFATGYYNGVQEFDQFTFESDVQLGLMDNKTYQIYRPYYFYQVFSQEFPEGGTLIPIKTPVDTANGVSMLALLAPDGKSLRLLVGNLKVANPTKDVNGNGVGKQIRVSLDGAISGHTVDTSQPATIWRFDASSPTNAAPAPSSFTLGTDNGTPFVQGPLAGYGAMIISVPLK